MTGGGGCAPPVPPPSYAPAGGTECTSQRVSKNRRCQRVFVSQETSRLPLCWQRQYLPTRCEVHFVPPVSPTGVHWECWSSNSFFIEGLWNRITQHAVKKEGCIRQLTRFMCNTVFLLIVRPLKSPSLQCWDLISTRKFCKVIEKINEKNRAKHLSIAQLEGSYY